MKEASIQCEMVLPADIKCLQLDQLLSTYI